jgi:tryptophan-rich sensory protein
MLWAQCIAMIVYTKWSHQYITMWTSFFFMFAANLIVWCIFIAAFVQQRDWGAGIALVCVGSACAAYHAFVIWRTITHQAYNVSWPDAVHSIVNFYSEPLMLVLF